MITAAAREANASMRKPNESVQESERKRERKIVVCAITSCTRHDNKMLLNN